MAASGVLACLAATPADGQQIRDPDESHSPKPSTFSLRFDDLYLEVESQLTDQKVRSRRIRRQDSVQTNRNFQLRESVGLGLSGDLIDPEVLDFSADLTLGLQQERYRERLDRLSLTDSATGEISDFDVSLDVLRSKPLSLNAYARRRDGRVARQFLPSLDEQLTESGLTFLLNTTDVTATFGFSQSQTKRSGNARVEDDERLRTQRAFIDATWTIADGHELQMAFEHERQASEYQGSTFDYNVNRTEWRLDHRLAFGEDDRHHWNSFLRINSESGDLARDEFEFATRLALQATDKLTTGIRYSFYRYMQDRRQSDLHKFDLDATYAFNDDMRLTGNVFAINENLERDVKTEEYGGLAALSFSRDNAWGTTSLDVSGGFRQTQISGRQATRYVRDEAHAMDDVRPVLLFERGVNAGTIIVHNLDRSRVFQVGADYIILDTQGAVRILRVPTGRIADGDVVYIDYVARLPTGSRIDSTNLAINVEHRFEMGLTPYYDFEGRFENVREGADTGLFRDNLNRHRLGVRYDQPRYGLGAELELFDDTIEPYHAVHLTGRRTWQPNLDHSLAVRGELSYYDFTGGLDARDVWWANVDASDRWQLDEYCALDTRLLYRFEHDSVDGRTNGVDFQSVFSYTRNYLSFELTFEYNLLAIEPSRDDGYGVYFTLRRDLGHLIG